MTTKGKRTKINGSMSVEAAFAVPLFIFCIINLLFGIQVIETSSRVTAALHETGNEICSYGYALENGISDGAPSGIISTAYTMASVTKHLGNVTNKRGGIRNNFLGINYLGTSIMNTNNIVDINVSYSLKFPFDIKMKNYILGAGFYGHAWTGYDGTGDHLEQEQDDSIVYITRTGDVYHTDIHCSYLNPSINAIEAGNIDEARNSNGSKYYQCEICKNAGDSGIRFVTDYGTRYHSNINCSGIKRNILTVHLSEVGGRRACSKCGG